MKSGGNFKESDALGSRRRKKKEEVQELKSAS